MKHELRLELSCPPDWARIDSIREAIALCVEAVYGDDSFSEALAMVGSELLENAVKYGRPDAESVSLAVTEDASAVTIEVANAIDPGATHAEALRERVEWLAGFPDAATAYQAALTSVYESPDPARSTSGLGIARIMYEGACTLACDTSQPGRVVVRARHAFAADAAAAHAGGDAPSPRARDA